MSKGEQTSPQDHGEGTPVEISLLTPGGVDSLQIQSPTRRRKRRFRALKKTELPNTYKVDPEVLTTSQIDLVKGFLTDNDPTRMHALLRVREANKEMRSRISRVGILLDGRGQERDEHGNLIKTPDGWWGDTAGSSSVVRTALQDGLDVTIFSTQPDLFFREHDDRITYARIPEETFPFQFYPFKNNDHSDLLAFLYSQQKADMAFWAPTNSRLPVYFRLERHRGDIRFDPRSQAVVDVLQMAVEGKITDTFGGITQKIWNEICHHTQAYQVTSDLMGLYRGPWMAFPRPYINPTPYAEMLAESIIRQLSPNGINTMFHIGGATNTPRKKEKFYPIERWLEFVDQLGAKGKDMIGSIIIFKPLNPQQAALSEQLAQHIALVFGEEHVIVVPMHRDWNLGAFAALARGMGKKGIFIDTTSAADPAVQAKPESAFVGIDSGPAHIAQAQGLPVVQIGNRAFDPEYYAPGGIVVLPVKGESAKRVDPEEIAEAFITIATTPPVN